MGNPEAVARSQRKPAFLAQNGTSYYGNRGEEVLTEASIVIRDDEEQEVEKFREFLDSVSPEDFEA